MNFFEVSLNTAVFISMDFTGANFSGADSELISVMQTSREPI
ncbi:MAG: hypothetical protein ACQZ3M_05265 [cyanobacterium endosymbiont of Rhopalodia fuxianensis]